MDTATLTQLYKRWRKPIRQWLNNGGRGLNAADCDDIAQEVFERLLRYDNDVLIGNPQGYLFTIAKNAASEKLELCAYKKPHMPVHLMGTEWSEFIESWTPEDDAERESRARQMNDIISKMPPQRQQVLMMHTKKDLTYKQIAAQADISDRQVLRELCKAYATLRAALL